MKFLPSRSQHVTFVLPPHDEMEKQQHHDDDNISSPCSSVASSSMTSTRTRRGRLDAMLGACRLSNNKKNQKAVRFDDETVILQCPEMTPAECEAVWYSPHEIASFQTRVEKTVARLRNELFQNTALREWYCSLAQGYQSSFSKHQQAPSNNVSSFFLPALGLERHILFQKKGQNYMLRKQLYFNVMACQGKRHLTQQRQARQIRHVCREMTVPAQQWAQHLAQVALVADSQEFCAHEDYYSVRSSFATLSNRG